MPPHFVSHPPDTVSMFTKPDDSVSHFDNHLGYWLQFVADHVTAHHARQLEEHDITVTEWVVLRALFDQPCLPYHVLMRILGMTRAAVWKAVHRLEARALICSELAQGEARMQELSLTKQGEALVPQLAALAADNELLLFLHLPPGVHRYLVATLKELAVRHHFGLRRYRRGFKNQPANGL
jgi:DNA-binding MarR family transcriptional regulator